MILNFDRVGLQAVGIDRSGQTFRYCSQGLRDHQEVLDLAIDFHDFILLKTCRDLTGRELLVEFPRKICRR